VRQFNVSWRLAFAVGALMFSAPLPAGASGRLKVAYGNTMPMSFRTSSGQPAGFAVEVMREAARREGIELEWRFGGPTIEANDQALRSGELDLIPTGIETADRRREFHITSAWWTSDLVLIEDRAASHAPAPGSRIAVPAMGQWTASEAYPKATVSPYPNAVSLVEAVCRGDADAALIMETSLREILFSPPAVCAGKGLRTRDNGALLEYKLISRLAVAALAEKLRARIDEIALDGTLASIASHTAPVASTKAIVLAELLRAVNGRERFRTLSAVGAGATVLIAGFAFWLYRSRRRLERLNRELKSARADLQRSVEQLSVEHDRLSVAEAGARFGIFDWDLRTTVALWSPQLQALYGFRPGEFDGAFATWVECLPIEGRDETVELARFSVMGGQSFRFRMIRRDTGEERWIESRGHVYRDAGGSPVRLVGVNIDVTDLVRAEEARWDSEQRWQFALEGSGDGVWDWNGETRTTFYSRQWKAMLGYEETDIGGTQAEFEDRIHPEDRDKVLEAMRRHFAGETSSYSCEYRLRCKDGNYKWILARGRVVSRSPEGLALRAIGTHTDLTPIKTAEAEREKLRAQFHQAQKMESVGRLAGGIAHDFNNLLTVINGYSALVLNRRELPQAVREPVEQIGRAGAKAEDLVRQLLTFSRNNAQAREPVDVNQLIGNLEATVLRLVGEDVRIVTNVAAALPPAMADPRQIEQVLINLAVNARDAMPEGGTLTIGTAMASEPDKSCAICGDVVSHKGHICVVVRDTGTGMNQDTMEHLFEPFFTTKPVGKGTGLGLAVVQGIVVQNSGHLTVRSELGKGTEFRLYLPTSEASGLVREVPAPRAQIAGGGTVLLVEDNPDVRHFAARALDMHGYRVVEAHDGQTALELLRGEQPDLLLTDIVMPGMNGRELAARASEMRPGLRTLFMSGYAGDRVENLAEAEFIRKPFLPDDLALKVRQVLTQSVSKLRILVVDDEPAVRSFLRLALESAGYSVEEASNGKDAIAWIGRGAPDLVITDLVMPEKEGIETIETLRRSHPKLPILAISGAWGGSYLKIAAHLGANAVLSKPVNPEELVSQVGEILRG
jgi:PAS domain S-box-containing protein